MESFDRRVVRGGRPPPGGAHRSRRTARVPDRTVHGPVTERQIYCARTIERGEYRLGQSQPPDGAGAFRGAASRPPELAGRQRALRSGVPCRRRPGLSPANPHHHRVRVAQSLRAEPFYRPFEPCPRTARPGVHGHRLAQLPGRSDAPRQQVASGHCRQFLEKTRACRRHQLRGRDQEIDLQHSQLHSAAQERAADALFGQHRAGGRRRPVFWPLRHRQDDAVERSGPEADWR